MSEVKRDAAPPGWFRRMWARIECVLDFGCAILFIYMGCGGLLALVLTMLKFGLDDVGDLLLYLVVLALSGFFFLLGLWCFREFRRDRRALRAMR